MKTLEELQKELEREDLTLEQYAEVLKLYLQSTAEDRVKAAGTIAALTAVVKDLLGFYVHCQAEKLSPDDYKVQTFTLTPLPAGGYSFSFIGVTPNGQP